MMMPHAVSKKISRLVNQLQLDYGNYAKYTETLDKLHTLIINDAQSFKPKRTYKKKEKLENDNAIPEGPLVVGTPSGKETTVFPDDRVDGENGGQE